MITARLLSPEVVHVTGEAPRRLHASVSQVEKFARCPRAWAYRYIAGIKAPPKASADLGTRVHELLESAILHLCSSHRWEVDGTSDPVAGPIAAAIGAQVPTAEILAAHLSGQFERVAETEFTVEIHGALVTGKVDYIAVSPEGEIEIGDFKTASSLTKAKRDPRTDLQAHLYLHVFDASAFRWIYGETRGSHRALSQSFTRSDADVNRSVSRIVRTVGEMTLLRYHRLPVVQIPARSAACGDYGGCDYRAICPHGLLDKEERIPMNFPQYMLNSSGQVVCDAQQRPLPPHLIQSQQVINPHTGALVPIAAVAAEPWIWQALADAAAGTGAPPQGPPLPQVHAPGTLGAVAAAHRIDITGLETVAATLATPQGDPWASHLEAAPLQAWISYLRTELAAGRSPYAKAPIPPQVSPITPPEAAQASALPPVPTAEAEKRKPGRPKKDPSPAPSAAPAPVAAPAPQSYALSAMVAPVRILLLGCAPRVPRTSDVHLEELIAAADAEATIKGGAARRDVSAELAKVKGRVIAARDLAVAEGLMVALVDWADEVIA